jgi:serine/threonine protein kinase
MLDLLPASVVGLFLAPDRGCWRSDSSGLKTAHLKDTWKLSDLELGATVGVGFQARVRVAKAKTAKGCPKTPPMALKIIDKVQVIKTGTVDNVKNEVRFLSTVDHPFIVKLHACWQDQKSIYMLMDFVNGGDLYSAIAKWEITEKQGQLWIAELVLAIEYLHSRDLAHRDVKPENTLLDIKGHLRLADFGFAKVVRTYLWTVCGTRQYMAPEMIQGNGHGCGVDWWALGVLTYFVFSGSLPFTGDTTREIHEKILSCKYEPLSHLTPGGKSLIGGLLQNRSQRLGCMHEGAEGIKTHEWFSGVDFNKVLHRRVPSSVAPAVSSAEDTSNFDEYPESAGRDLPALSAEEQALFDFDFCEHRVSEVDISERIPFPVPVDCMCCSPT